ncbi:MAG: hypothetical protein AAF937_00095 [Planctomycetota bacterium]
MRYGAFLAVATAVVAGATLPAASADGQRAGRGYDHGGVRGSLCIGRDTHEFWFDDSPTHGILASFRKCGYDAWLDRGDIYVRYHGHRPRFTLRAKGFSFGVRYARGCVVISPKCLAPPPKKHIRYRVRDSWGHDACPPRQTFRHRGHRGHRYGPRIDWNVRWGWGHRSHFSKHRGWRHSRRCR